MENTQKETFIERLNQLYEKRFPPTFERPNPFSGEMEVMPSGVTDASNVSALFCGEIASIIAEARKEFPVPYAVLRFKTAKGLGLGNVNTFKLKKWLEKWFGEGKG